MRLGKPALGSWLRRTQCVMVDADANEIALGGFATEIKPYAGQLMQFVLTRRADGTWPTCAMIFDGAHWLDVNSEPGIEFMKRYTLDLMARVKIA
jgi:hypothetical protein